MAYLCFSISNSVTQKEWTKVYEETLDLANKLNLADWGKFYYKGIRHYAYCKVKEQTEKEFNKEKHFWLACGEYEYMGDGEYFRLDREINTSKYNKNAVPAILSEFKSYNNDNQVRNRAIKTYRGTYYIRLLALLCYMESRLKEKIFIRGDELSKYFGNQIDVKNFLKEEIKDEDEDSFITKAKEYCKKDSYYLFEGEDKYDFIFASDLILYKTGNKIAPCLLEDIKEAVKTNKKRLEDKEFKELSKKETTEQIYELIDIKHQFPVRDIDWHHAIDYFNSHSDALERYYPLFRMKFELFTPTEDIARALFINDEFYEFCKGV